MSYTVEFFLRCKLQNLTKEAKDVLSYLFNPYDGRRCGFDSEGNPCKEIRFDIDHDFFREEWYYKIGRFIHDINCRYLNLEYNELASINDFKNDTYLIDLFLDWLLPYIDEEDGKVIGWIVHEEILVPELIYYRCDDNGENPKIEMIYAKDVTRV
jgi:hypothetical protein